MCKANNSSCLKLPISSLYAMRLVLWWLHWKLCGNHSSPLTRLLDSQKYYRTNYGRAQVQSCSHLITKFQTWPRSGGGTMLMMRVPVFGFLRRGEMKWTWGWAKPRSKYFGQAWWQVLLSGWGSLYNSPVRYVLKIHFFIEFGLKMIQFKIQFKTNPEYLFNKIFIQ